MSDSDNATALGFLIFPGFPMSCLTSAIEPLRAANEIADRRAFDWKLISETGARVNSSARVGFDPDMALAEARGLDYLFLLGGPPARFDDPRSGNGHLRSLARHGARMGGVSGGVFPLARSGLLAGHVCSVHWCYEAAFRAEFPDHAVQDDVIVIDRGRLTVSGAAAAFDLMLNLIEDRLGARVTTEVACWFQHPLMRGQGVRQKVPVSRSEGTSDMLPEPVRRAADIFAGRIDDTIGVAEVARMLGLSARHLERIFKAATGQSPKLYYRKLRMNAARQLVRHSNDNMLAIANAVGYSAAAPMIRRYRETFGATPMEDRRRINRFRVGDNRPVPS